jgi:hypothetical protein
MQQEQQEPLSRLRKQEHIHIYFWLVKDLSWVMGITWLGTAMVIPTLALAIIIAVQSRTNRLQFWPNLAVCFWICANVVWMLGEFYDFTYKHGSISLFVTGIACMMQYLKLLYTQRNHSVKN